MYLIINSYKNYPTKFEIMKPLMRILFITSAYSTKHKICEGSFEICVTFGVPFVITKNTIFRNTQGLVGKMRTKIL